METKTYLLPAGIMIISFTALFAISRLMAKNGGDDGDQDSAGDGGKKSKREVADQEKNKIMSDLGKKGAAKRWAKKKKVSEHREESTEEESDDNVGT